MQPNAAIYHFTNESKHRPKVYKDQLQALKYFANAHEWNVSEIFCDFSLNKSEHPEFDRFLAEADKYDVLVVKDFYHISKNTMECMRIMKLLRDKGITIYSIENGYFVYTEVPLDKPLRVVTYSCRYGLPNEIKQSISVQNDIFSYFIRRKTNWTLIEQFSDESEHQNDQEQKQLITLISNRDKYDLLLVNNLNDIHWRTSKFCKRREDLQLDIYSMQDGFLSYRKD